MALPTVPYGYDSWNQYIETNAPALALAENLTLQEAKASIKLKMVAMPIRQASGEPYYRAYNIFTTWADRTVSPTLGRPWKLDPNAPYWVTCDQDDITCDNDNHTSDEEPVPGEPEP